MADVEFFQNLSNTVASGAGAIYSTTMGTGFQRIPDDFAVAGRYLVTVYMTNHTRKKRKIILTATESERFKGPLAKRNKALRKRQGGSIGIVLPGNESISVNGKVLRKLAGVQGSRFADINILISAAGGTNLSNIAVSLRKTLIPK